MAGDALRVVVGRGKGRIAVGLVGVHHGNHLGRIAAQVGLANPVAGARQRNRQAVRRQARAVVDVVHALETGVLQRVDFQNDLVGLVQPGVVVADRRRGNQPAVRQDARDLDHRHIEVAQKAEPGQLRHMRQVDVGVLHLPGVDLLAHHRVGLVGQAHLDAIDLGQRAVELGRGRGAGPQADAEGLARGVQALNAPRQRLGHGLGVARAGKAAHADIGARGNQLGGRFGRHDFVVQGGVAHAIGKGHERRAPGQGGGAAAQARKFSRRADLTRVNPRLLHPAD